MAIIVKDKSFYKTLLALSVPVMLQSLLTFGIGFADNLMVGTLGESAISAVYIGNQIQMLLHMFMLGVVGAMQVISTQYWGKKDVLSIKKIVAISVRVTICVTLMISAAALIFPQSILRIFTNDPHVINEGLEYLRFVGFSYLFFGISQVLIGAMRSVETVKIGMYISILALFTDVLLNWILIFGKLGLPTLGVRGAAIATLFSRIFEAFVMIWFVLKRDSKLSLRLAEITLKSKELLKDYIRFGLPIIAGQFIWAINNFFHAFIAGQMGTSATASISILGMLSSMVSIAIFGLAAALSIITGKTVGAGQYEKMKDYARTSQVIFFLLGIMSAIVVLLVGGRFLRLYNINEETYFIGKQMIYVLSITVFGRSYQATLLRGLVKAGGDTGFVFKNDTIFVFLTIIPSALLALYVFNAPAWVVYACLQSDQLTKCFVAVVKINRFNWMKNLTREIKQTD